MSFEDLPSFFNHKNSWFDTLYCYVSKVRITRKEESFPHGVVKSRMLHLQRTSQCLFFPRHIITNLLWYMQSGQCYAECDVESNRRENHQRVWIRSDKRILPRFACHCTLCKHPCTLASVVCIGRVVYHMLVFEFSAPIGQPASGAHLPT